MVAVCPCLSTALLYRYFELSSLSPVEAVAYLQTTIASLVDHTDHDESKEVRISGW
jgi:hypothetical protein